VQAGRAEGTPWGAEQARVKSLGLLEDGLRQAGDWYLWGPYVSERQWGSVREDYTVGDILRLFGGRAQR